MPIGIVSDLDFNLEVGNDYRKSESDHTLSNQLVRASILPMADLGRGNTKATPEIMREIIGDTAITESGRDVSEAFGISQSSVSAYKVGAHSTSSYNKPDQQLKENVNKKRYKISNKASNRLVMALDSITPEKLSEVKVKDAASIAKDMSAVIKNMEPDHGRENGPAVQFVFFSPRQKTESDYEIIHVND